MNTRQLWIWQHSHYPNFDYDREEISAELLIVLKKQGELEGTLKHLSAKKQEHIFTQNMLDEIIYNSSIEGEILQRSSVRASIRNQIQNLNDPSSDKHTDNIVSIQKDVNQNHKALTKERLNHWHYEIMVTIQHQTKRGK